MPRIEKPEWAVLHMMEEELVEIFYMKFEAEYLKERLQNLIDNLGFNYVINAIHNGDIGVTFLYSGKDEREVLGEQHFIHEINLDLTSLNK